MVFLLISRMFIYILLLLSIMSTFYSLFDNTNLISGRCFPLDWLWTLRFSPWSLNSYCSFAVTRVSVLLFILMISWSLLCMGLQDSLSLVVLSIGSCWITYSFSMNSVSCSNLLLWGCVERWWTCLSVYHLTNLLRSSSWLMLCYRSNLLQSIRLCPFRQDNLLCQWTCTNLLAVSCHSEWMVTILLLTYSFLFTFHFKHSISCRCCLNCDEFGSLMISSSWCGYCYQCYALSLGLLYIWRKYSFKFLKKQKKKHWSFIFRVLGFLSCCGTKYGSISKGDIALQELLTFALMLHKMTFQLSGKVLALHLENVTAKAYLCNQGDRVYLLLSRVACHILNLANKLGITFVPA